MQPAISATRSEPRTTARFTQARSRLSRPTSSPRERSTRITAFTSSASRMATRSELDTTGELSIVARWWSGYARDWANDVIAS